MSNSLLAKPKPGDYFVSHSYPGAIPVVVRLQSYTDKAHTRVGVRPVSLVFGEISNGADKKASRYVGVDTKWINEHPFNPYATPTTGTYQMHVQSTKIPNVKSQLNTGTLSDDNNVKTEWYLTIGNTNKYKYSKLDNVDITWMIH